MEFHSPQPGREFVWPPHRRFRMVVQKCAHAAAVPIVRSPIRKGVIPRSNPNCIELQKHALMANSSSFAHSEWSRERAPRTKPKSTARAHRPNPPNQRDFVLHQETREKTTINTFAVFGLSLRFPRDQSGSSRERVRALETVKSVI